MSLRALDIQCLNECINVEWKIGEKLCPIVAFYRAPRQSQKNFKTYIDNFELYLETLSQKNLIFLVAIGDNSTSQGKALENVTS